MPTINRKPVLTRERVKGWSDSEERDKFKHMVYSSARWRELRTVYLQHHPLCELCEREGRYTLTEDIHHIESFADHRDNWQMYAYSYNNLMALCKECHGRLHAEKQKEEL